jgi:DNA adenine methylase
MFSGEVTHTAFRYYGGKFRLADWIISHFPKHEVYVEPFGGAASVLLKKPFSRLEVLNDLSSEIYNFFHVLRNQELGEELKRQLDLTPISREDFEQCVLEKGITPVEKARRFYVRVNLSYQKISEDLLKSNFTVPNSDRTAASAWFAKIANLDAIAKRLKTVILENKPALQLIDQYDGPKTLFYCDPPYLIEERSRARKSYDFEMTNQDHDALARRLNKVKGKVILSGYQNDLYDGLYRDWTRLDKQTKGSAKEARIESIWLSPNIRSRECRLF